MCKKTIFNTIIQVASQVSEIESSDILSKSKRSDIVDARCISYRLCRKYGLSSRDIASMVGKINVSAINDLINTHDMRYSYSYCYRRMYTDAERKLDGMVHDDCR